MIKIKLLRPYPQLYRDNTRNSFGIFSRQFKSQVNQDGFEVGFKIIVFGDLFKKYNLDVILLKSGNLT